jgi:predicted DNA-binding protein (MmcQ/YjbR family)
MNAELIREYCLKKKEVTESFPFNDTALVFKVHGKMFLLLSLETSLSLSLKCDPEKAINLRERYSSVIPGYHFNKKHWNTIYIDGSIDEKLIFDWIDHSYELVIRKFPKSIRELLEG